LAKLHDDIVVIGGLNDVDDADYVVVLETAVDLQFLLDCFCHVGIVVDFISVGVHCDF
jgi:hypothetical protein